VRTSSSGTLSSQNINGVYIPSALIIVGVAIVKREWLPYALVVVSLLGGYKVFNNRMRNVQAEAYEKAMN
jgi:cytochrome-b5 reductase